MIFANDDHRLPVADRLLTPGDAAYLSVLIGGTWPWFIINPAAKGKSDPVVGPIVTAWPRLVLDEVFDDSVAAVRSIQMLRLDTERMVWTASNIVEVCVVGTRLLNSAALMVFRLEDSPNYVYPDGSVCEIEASGLLLFWTPGLRFPPRAADS